MHPFKTLFRIAAAGILAAAILCILFSFYSVTPVHIPNKLGNTDYVWPAGSRWVTTTEGISRGRFDANGFNNPEVIENPDIVVLGSSHMEAKNVMQDENMAYLLSRELGGSHSVYNMGISGHHFTKVCKYLPDTLSVYSETPEYIVIETSTTAFTVKQINALLEGNIAITPSRNTGVIAALQKLPFLRRLYFQLEDGLLDLFLPELKGTKNESVPSEPLPGDVEYEAMFSYIHDAVKDHDTRLIIAYHPGAEICEDGSITIPQEETAELFAKKCEKYGFIFVDLTQDFYDMYEADRTVPHGFSTGKLGSGHLNTHGHAAMARAVAKTILETEAQD